MTRILMGLAVAALTASTAAADPGGFAPPRAATVMPANHAAPAAPGATQGTLVGAMSAPAGPARAPDRFGLLPGLRNMFQLNKSSCSTCGDGHGHKGGGCGPGGCGPFGHGAYGGAPAAYPPVNQGTLVFPHHPYVRSPRDYFMYEPGR